MQKFFRCGVDITDKIGIYAVPAVIVIVVLIGAFKKTDLFGSFTEGAKEGVGALVSVAPSLIGLIIAVSMLEASGFFDMLTCFLAPACSALGIPSEVVPLGLMRPVTGSGSFAMLSSVLDKYGPDSIIGKTASVMAGSTETTFYAITVYYGAAGIKNTRHTVPAALCADMIGMLLACFTVKML